jgi:5'-phosphate synthase pdxT subunit
MRKKIGILSLQGCVEPHVLHLEALGVEVIRVKKPEQLKSCDALIIPGGESTTFLNLLSLFDFYPALEEFHKSQKPAWGICAGAIMMAKEVVSPQQKSLGWIDLTIERNAYGRQIDSEVFNLRGSEVALIRAPKIKKFDNKKIQITDQRDGEILSARQDHYFVSTFHPELSSQVPSVFHREFVNSF